MLAKNISFIFDNKSLIFVDDFLNNFNVKKYIMGYSRDGYASDVYSRVAIDGLIDDFTTMSSFDNLKIFKTEELDRNSLILVCSTVRTKTAVEKLKSLGFSNVLDYPTFYKHCSNISLRLRIIDLFDKDYECNFNQYDWLHNILVDESSKYILEQIIYYRITVNMNYLSDFKFSPELQYFDDVIHLSEDVFIDAGAYDGQTTLEFINRCPSYRSAYVFEPSNLNLDKAKNNLADYRNVNFIEKGLSNKAEVLRFHSNNGSASAIADDGDVEIQVDSLDNLVQEKVTFIKMDIEGAESLAIEGAKNHILNDHPKMAIAVYHKADDLWKIPQQVLAIRDDYDLYLRHYTEGTDETIMYFIPKI